MQDLSQLFAIIWTVAALLVLSGTYPAYNLAKMSKPSARMSLKVVALLTAAAPLILLAFDRLHATPATNDARALQAMPIQISALPALYVISSCTAAVVLWLLFAWHHRRAA
jgi:hypothetical protein